MARLGRSFTSAATLVRPRADQPVITADASLASTVAVTADATRGAVGAVTIGETFAVVADATRGTSSDASLTETFTVTAAATRGVNADVTIGATLSLTVDATVTSAALAPRPPVQVQAAAIAAAQAAARQPRQPVIAWAPGVVFLASADAALAAAFGITVSADVAPPTATRGPVVVNLEATARAARLTGKPGSSLAPVARGGPGSGQTSDVAVTETFALTAAASRGTSGDVALAETFSTTAAATRGAVGGTSVALAFGLTADATVTTASSTPRPSVLTAGAVASAGYPRSGRVIVSRSVVTPVAGSADVAIGEAFSTAVSASVGVSGAVALAETLGLSVDAVRGAVGGVSAGFAFGLTSTATVGPVGSVTVAETFTLAASATRGAVPALALTETFAIAATAVLAGVGQVAIGETFAVTASATRGATGGVAPVVLAFATSVSAIVTSGAIVAPHATAGPALQPRITSASEPTGVSVTG